MVTSLSFARNVMLFCILVVPICYGYQRPSIYSVLVRLFRTNTTTLTAELTDLVLKKVNCDSCCGYSIRYSPPDITIAIFFHLFGCLLGHAVLHWISCYSDCWFCCFLLLASRGSIARDTAQVCWALGTWGTLWLHFSLRWLRCHRLDHSHLLSRLRVESRECSACTTSPAWNFR